MEITEISAAGGVIISGPSTIYKLDGDSFMSPMQFADQETAMKVMNLIKDAAEPARK